MKAGCHARVLFVCMGNICRSPTAQGVFSTLVEREWRGARVVVDSAGTHDYQIGQPPFVHAVAAAKRRGYSLPAHRARQVDATDFERFDWILAMDRANLEALTSLRPAGYEGHLGLLLDLVPGANIREVPDPYYGPTAAFDRALELVEQGSRALIARLRAAQDRGRPGAPIVRAK
ncbi:MAG: low molecular weight protein-tyrosine-phosphatase [Betaproteobacteria bacterium]